MTNDTGTNETTSSTNEGASKSITKAEPRTNNLPERTSYADEANPLSGGAMQDSDRIYLYAILVIVAVYLMLRH